MSVIACWSRLKRQLNRTRGDEAAAAAAETSDGETSAAAPEYREETFSLFFGAQLDDGVVLKSSDADYYVLTRDTVFNAFNDLSRADLVKAPAAEAEPTASSSQ